MSSNITYYFGGDFKVFVFNGFVQEILKFMFALRQLHTRFWGPVTDLRKIRWPKVY